MGKSETEKREAARREKRERVQQEIPGGGKAGWIAFGVTAVALVVVLLIPLFTGSCLFTKNCDGTFRLCVDADWTYDADPNATIGSLEYYGVRCSQNLWDVVRNNGLDTQAKYDTYMAAHPTLADDLGFVELDHGYVANLWGLMNHAHLNNSAVDGCIDIPFAAVFVLAILRVEILDQDGNIIDVVTFDFIGDFDIEGIDQYAGLAGANATRTLTCQNSLVTVSMQNLSYLDIDEYEGVFLINGANVTIAGIGG